MLLCFIQSGLLAQAMNSSGLLQSDGLEIKGWFKPADMKYGQHKWF